MNLLNLILPTHAKITGVLCSQPDQPKNGKEDKESFASFGSFGSNNLTRFEPWLLGLRNMIEEGDWHSAQVFAEQIRTRLRHLELAEKCDAEGVVRR